MVQQLPPIVHLVPFLPCFLLVFSIPGRPERFFYIFYSVFYFPGIVDLIRAHQINFHVMKNDLLSCLPQKNELCMLSR